MVGFDHQSLGQLALAKDTDAVGRAVGQAGVSQRVWVHGGAVFELLVEVADVDHVEAPVPGGVAETALGNAAEKGHLAAFKHADRHVRARTRPLPLAAPRGGLATAAPRTPANTLLALQLANAMMH